MFCPNCGNKVKEGSKYCSKCGTPVKKSSVSDNNEGPLIEHTEILSEENNTILENNEEVLLKQEAVSEDGSSEIRESSPVTDTTEILADESTDQQQINFPVHDNSVGSSEVDDTPQKRKNGKGARIAILIGMFAVVLVLSGVLSFYFLFGGQSKVKAMEFEGYLKRAEKSLEKNDLEAAVGYYKRAIEVDPEKDIAYINLAQVYYAQKKIPQAIKTLETGVDITKSDEAAELLDVYSRENEGLDGPENNNDNEESVEKSTENEKPINAEEASDSLAPVSGEKENIDIEVRQVDNSKFPEVALYASVIDGSGEVVENLQMDDFNIQEIDKNGNVIDATIDDMYQVINEDKISIELVMDASGSMDYNNKMQQAKNAAISLVNEMSERTGDQIEVISFNDYVYLNQSFTNSSTELKPAIEGINSMGGTALYDGIYAGLYQTNLESGSKCVIAFTDGEENVSSYSFDDVVNMAKNTGIPVFVVGIGSYNDINESVLKSLANQCSGKYYSALDTDLEKILEDIYISIYKEQQDYYVVKYTTSNVEDKDSFRDVVLKTSDISEFTGYYKKSYIPETDISGAFSSEYSNRDYILDFTSNEPVDINDLDGLSLAQLRIARNEIYARHGRQFKDPLLNQWFYSKTWYLNLNEKYSPNDFDQYNPNPLSKLERSNAEFILSYEKAKMQSEEIYPNAASSSLSEYDLALSKPVLKVALAQMRQYSSTDTLEDNIRKVQEKLNKEDVQY